MTVISFINNPYFVSGVEKQLIVKIISEDIPTSVAKVVFKVEGKTVKDGNGKVIYVPVENGIATLSTVLTQKTGQNTLKITCAYISNTERLDAEQYVTCYQSEADFPSDSQDQFTSELPISIDVDQGLAKVHLTKQLNPGTYLLNGAFLGTVTYAPAQDTGTITISKIPTETNLTILEGSRYTMGSSLTLYVEVTPIVTGTVTVYVNDKPQIFNQALNADSTVTITHTPSGTQNISVEYSGDETHEKSISNTIAVSPIKKI